MNLRRAFVCYMIPPFYLPTIVWLSILILECKNHLLQSTKTIFNRRFGGKKLLGAQDLKFIVFNVHILKNQKEVAFLWYIIWHMLRMPITVVIVLLLISPQRVYAQFTTFVTQELLQEGIDVTNLEYYLNYSGETPFDSIQTRRFESINDTVELPPFAGIWLRWRLHNDSPDTVCGVIRFDAHFDKIGVWQDSSANWTAQVSGARMNCCKHSILLDDCVPFMLLSGQSRVVYARLEIHDGKTLKMPFVRLRTEVNARYEEERNFIFKRGSPLRREIFVQILFFLSLLISVTLLIVREKILAWYATHTLFVLIYLGMNVGVVLYHRAFFCAWREWTLLFQALATYAVLACYINFARILLDIGTENKRFDRVLLYFINLILVLSLIQVGLSFLSTPSNVFTFYKYGRLICLPIWIGLTISFALCLSDPMRWYILLGSIAKILPTLFVLLHHILPGEYVYVKEDVLRMITTPRGKYYMYTAQIGVLIELTLFVVAVAFKIAQERRSIRKLVDKVNEQYSMDRLKTTESSVLKSSGPPEIKAEPEPSDFMSKVSSTIAESYANPNFGVEELAKKMHCSRVTLYRKISQETNEKPSKLITNARLTHAAQMLKTTKTNISEISIACGYADPNYFTKAFTDHFKVNPATFRKQNSGQQFRTIFLFMAFLGKYLCEMKQIYPFL
jgi:AraC-like DNA-binding protein